MMSKKDLKNFVFKFMTTKVKFPQLKDLKRLKRQALVQYQLIAKLSSIKNS